MNPEHVSAALEARPPCFPARMGGAQLVEAAPYWGGLLQALGFASIAADVERTSTAWKAQDKESAQATRKRKKDKLGGMTEAEAIAVRTHPVLPCCTYFYHPTMLPCIRDLSSLDCACRSSNDYLRRQRRLWQRQRHRNRVACNWRSFSL